MASPKWKTSKSKRNTRRAHDALRPNTLSNCKNCNEPKIPHYVCGSCGHYAGGQVMDPKRSGTDFTGEDFSVED